MDDSLESVPLLTSLAHYINENNNLRRRLAEANELIQRNNADASKIIANRICDSAAAIERAEKAEALLDSAKRQIDEEQALCVAQQQRAEKAEAALEARISEDNKGAVHAMLQGYALKDVREQAEAFLAEHDAERDREWVTRGWSRDRDGKWIKLGAIRMALNPKAVAPELAVDDVAEKLNALEATLETAQLAYRIGIDGPLADRDRRIAELEAQIAAAPRYENLIADLGREGNNLRVRLAERDKRIAELEAELPRRVGHAYDQGCMSMISRIKELEGALRIVEEAIAGDPNRCRGCWKARAFLDARDIYHGDLADLRIIHAVAKAALSSAPPVADRQVEAARVWQSDIRELLARAYKYDDKPHQLYSWIEELAWRYEDDPEVRAEIVRLMDRCYAARAQAGERGGEA